MSHPDLAMFIAEPDSARRSYWGQTFAGLPLVKTLGVDIRGLFQFAGVDVLPLKGNWMPCTVIRPWSTFSGWIESELSMVETLPWTATSSHCMPTSPKPPSSKHPQQSRNTLRPKTLSRL